MKQLVVFTIAAYGGQVTGTEINREVVPAWLAPMVADQIARFGYCNCRFDSCPEFIAYPTREAAEHAIAWSLN